MPQIRGMRRCLPLAIVLLLAPAPARAAGDAMAKYSTVVIEPATAYFYTIATVSMTYQPFVRQKGAFSSTYSARVFPYFFFNERGKIWIEITDEMLRQADRGESVDFIGRAFSNSGDERKIEGHATPTGPSTGKIRVRVIVSRRIVLTYETTYELQGAPGARPAVTPR
jgi:hypothetical protein